jgi:hypothetical protein
MHAFNGYRYASHGECMLAELLTNAGIPFTPDVHFDLEKVRGKPRIFVPDFIFDGKPYLWSSSVVIHGIEVKGTDDRGDFSLRARDNVSCMWKQRKIRVLLLSNANVRRYYERGSIPLTPFRP